MALPREMIDLRGLHPGENAAQRRAVGQVAVVEKEPVAVDGCIRAKMFDSGSHQVARAPNDTVNGIAFAEKQLGEIRTVLTGDAGDERAFRFRHDRSMIQGCGVDKLEPWRDALLHVFIQGGVTSTRSLSRCRFNDRS